MPNPPSMNPLSITLDPADPHSKENPSAPTGESDDETGFLSTPVRYATASGREAIDIIRDSMTDLEFIAYCDGQKLKYELRMGKKGEADAEKARWYGEMSTCVTLGRGNYDPRRDRPGFQPYVREIPPPGTDRNLQKAQIDVLDHGFVRFIESWGGGDNGIAESGIIEAARQSTQGSFRGWESDRKLLRYLHEHKHSTPFEFAGLVLEVRAPIFVFREWMRHRTQCLAPDTRIALVSPRGTAFSRTIQEIYDLKHGGVIDNAPSRHRNGTSKIGTPVTREARRKDPWRTRILPNCQSRVLRVIDEATGDSTTAKMADVWEAGVKEIFAVSTASGRIVRCSADHPFYTRDGWAKARDLSAGGMTGRIGKIAAQEQPIPPSLRQGIGVWTSMMRKRLILSQDVCYLCGRTFWFDDLELDHVIPVCQHLPSALDVENLRPACRPCHREKTSTEQVGTRTKMGVRWDRIMSVVRVAESQTYDIEVEGPHHNFIADGLIVHNSYNEMSARYTPLPDLYYVPTKERVLMLPAGGGKQSSRDAAATEAAEHNADAFIWDLEECYSRFQAAYEDALATGIPKELARCGMPVGHYSQMRVSANLRNWLGFLTLRLDPAAQWEIRMYAEAVLALVETHFPETAALFNSQRENAP